MRWRSVGKMHLQSFGCHSNMCGCVLCMPSYSTAVHALPIHLPGRIFKKGGPRPLAFLQYAKMCLSASYALLFLPWMNDIASRFLKNCLKVRWSQRALGILTVKKKCFEAIFKKVGLSPLVVVVECSSNCANGYSFKRLLLKNSYWLGKYLIS